MESRFLSALHCRNSGPPPLWLMRQAGRYLPEYRALRAKYSFLDMCHQPDLIAEVTLMPLRRFDIDAAILFSDILIILEVLGRTVRFEDGRGPVIDRPLRSIQDVRELKVGSVVDTLSFVTKGIRALRPQLKVPLIGFCGAPFTVASYLIEGGSSKDLALTKQWMFHDPKGFHELLQLIAQVDIDYLRMQVAAGVDVIQLFDSWAHTLAYPQFREFSLAYLEKIVVALADTKVPVILFCRGSSVFAPDLATLAPAAIGLDWNCSMREMRQRLSPHVALQGNLDPSLLLAPRDVIRKEAGALIDSMADDPGFIFGLGHGVLPQTPIEAVQTLVECVKTRASVSV